MAPKLGIIAGGGDLPGLVAAACRAQGRPFHFLALSGHADPQVIGQEAAQDWIRLGEAGTGFERLRQAGVAEVVMIGPVRRPTLMELAPDFRTARFFARVGLKALGDDGLLRAVAAELESEGFKVVGVDDVLSDCLATPGPYGSRTPDEQAQADITRGIAVARGLGALDVGQAVVVQQGIVLGVEAIEGTDNLIRRCGPLAREGEGGVLVKLKKPGQDRRIDLPTIGLTTLREAASAGLRGIAVEAGGALVLGGKTLGEEADRLGLFVTGIEFPPC
ncbi:UDP-2 3-diacylglucosamine pyrophosphatase [Paramagnetospirillum magnetotacticum MS-1]|uniref:UDP-2 3-diacylglucosamine pyrophosphatase n=1 Tax=Paramagnetospirillum magnetotacticum MS-1 TaxID=272627 RepID=A0A0C2YGK6_PARME|nr:UDP-2,3-diacylglucosamine diphosphatase LpxI [Paramagnetospirillum magnetotacticum]KIL98894.1 UDP-2 3-diacylglucosamine pyrophosphatase [Paramagnetospirillum magnetotacticum MS-1]